MESIETSRERAAAGAREARARQEEFMSLADGIGVIPPEYRNLGYKKLEFEPGEGGIGNLLAGGNRPQSQAAAPAQDDRVTAFLAGVASGADAEKLAAQLLAGQAGETTTARRARRGEKEAMS